VLSDDRYRESQKIHRSVLGVEIVPTLVEYTRIPNKSSAFDPDWVVHGSCGGRCRRSFICPTARNAHGPNEFLHIPTGRRVSLVIAQVLADHAAPSGVV
jgi:hypothetical protein